MSDFTITVSNETAEQHGREIIEMLEAAGFEVDVDEDEFFTTYAWAPADESQQMELMFLCGKIAYYLSVNGLELSMNDICCGSVET